MQDHVAASGSVDRLLATGQAYMGFARAEPHLSTVMFGPDGVSGRDRALASGAPSVSASDQLRRALRERGVDVEALLLRTWGLAHGLASLLVAGAVNDGQAHR